MQRLGEKDNKPGIKPDIRSSDKPPAGRDRTGRDRTGRDRTGNDRTGSDKARESLPLLFDYKDPLSLYPFLEGGKISGARSSGLRRKLQRRLGKAVKKARSLSLLPSSYQAYDDFQRPLPISPKPFDYK